MVLFTDLPLAIYVTNVWNLVSCVGLLCLVIASSWYVLYSYCREWVPANLPSCTVCLYKGYPSVSEDPPSSTD